MKTRPLLLAVYPGIGVLLLLAGMKAGSPGSAAVNLAIAYSLQPLLWFCTVAALLRFAILGRAPRPAVALGMTVAAWFMFCLGKQRLHPELASYQAAGDLPTVVMASIPYVGPALTLMAFYGEVASESAHEGKRVTPSYLPPSTPKIRFVASGALQDSLPPATGLAFACMLRLLCMSSRQEERTDNAEEEDTAAKRARDAPRPPGASAGTVSAGSPPQPDPEPAALWHLLAEDGVRGPYPLADLTAMQASGELASHVLVRRVGSDAWVPLREQTSRSAASTPARTAQEVLASLLQGLRVPAWAAALVFAVLVLGVAFLFVAKPGRNAAPSSASAAPSDPKTTPAAPVQAAPVTNGDSQTAAKEFLPVVWYATQENMAIFTPLAASLREDPYLPAQEVLTEVAVKTTSFLDKAHAEDPATLRQIVRLLRPHEVPPLPAAQVSQ